MGNQEFDVVCPRCGNVFKSTARCCIKCGYMNPYNPNNEQYIDKYGQDEMEEYSISGKTGDVTVHSRIVRRNGNKLSYSSHVGSFSLCFILNYLCYVLLVGGIIYYYYKSYPNVQGVIGSDLSYILIGITVFSIIQYGTQLVYMKMDKRWILALIPFVNLFVFSDALNQNKLMSLLVFVPIVGEIYLLYLLFKMGKAFGKSGILTVLFPCIMIPIIGFGGSSFHDIYYISNRDSLEKEHGKKKFFWVTCVLVIIASVAMIIYSNFANIRMGVSHINEYYLYYAAQKTVEKTELKVNAGLYECRNSNEVMYFYFKDVYDYVFLPFYSFRDPIRAYVKVEPVYNSQGEKVYQYSISMTDETYGFAETPVEELSVSTVTKYTTLDDVFDRNNRCEFHISS